MAKVTHVKKAQQRYATVPVIDLETGQPKQTPVMRGDGTQKTTKRGALVFMTVTRADKDQPLPPETCDYCQKDIEVGTPYKHVTPKSGPYGGRKRSRHEDCPTWQPWDLSNSLSARVAQIESVWHDGIDQATEPGDVEAVVSEVAEMIREIASEKEEAASNMEDGFGHETEQSAEIKEQGESLGSWADEIEGQPIPDLPEPEEEDRWFVVNADGSGDVFEDQPDGWETQEEAQAALDAFLEQTSNGETPEQFEVVERPHAAEEPSDEQMDEWRNECRDLLGDAPV